MTSRNLLLSAADRPLTAWKNGRGSTAEILRFPENTEDFHWRLSIAQVSGDDDFSEFPGVDRIIMPLSEAGLLLREDGRDVRLDRFETHEFEGESAVGARGVRGTVNDLNLMTRRGVVAGSMRAMTLPRDVLVDARESTVLICLEGFCDVVLDTETIRLESGDALVLAESARLDGRGTIADARIRRV